jgi:hypothetical protein
MNALAARGRFGAGQILMEHPRFRGHRGVVQLRNLTVFVTPQIESPAESLVLLQIVDAGLPVPVAQLLVRDEAGVIVARLDFGYPEIRLAVEFDGVEFHSTPEQLAHDRRRRDRLKERGWTILVLTKDEVYGRQPTTAALVEAAIAEAIG